MNEYSFRADDCPEKIIRLYSNTVYRLAFAKTRNKADADDIYQEVMMRYIRKKPHFESEEHRKAWFLRVTINCTKKLWSSAFRRYTEAFAEEMVFETKEENDLSDYLQKLPEKYRVVIHLFYYEDMSIEQISGLLSRNPSTVRA